MVVGWCEARVWCVGGGDDARELDALLGSTKFSDWVRLLGLLPLLLGPLDNCGVGRDVMEVLSLVYGMWKLGGGIAKCSAETPCATPYATRSPELLRFAMRPLNALTEGGLPAAVILRLRAS